jgi:hypothetical protein
MLSGQTLRDCAVKNITCAHYPIFGKWAVWIANAGRCLSFRRIALSRGGIGFVLPSFTAQ